VLAHAGDSAERFGYDGSGKMIIIASQIFDGDLGVWEGRLD